MRKTLWLWSVASLHTCAHLHYMCMHTQDETGTRWSVFLVRNKRFTRLKSQTAECSDEFLLIEMRAKVNRAD